jgi:ankyrin repeat protein
MKKLVVILAIVMVFAAATGSAQAKDFFILVRNGTPQEVQQAIDSGADVNEYSTAWKTTPLGQAASYNTDPGVIVVLLKAGAAIAPNADGWTPLMAAAWSNANPAVITTLLEGGLEIDSPYAGYHGRTALMFAAEHNQNPEVLLALLKGGADVRVKDADGNTALDAAKHNYVLKRSAAYRQLEEASKD